MIRLALHRERGHVEGSRNHCSQGSTSIPSRTRGFVTKDGVGGSRVGVESQVDREVNGWEIKQRNPKHKGSDYTDLIGSLPRTGQGDTISEVNRYQRQEISSKMTEPDPCL